MAPPATPGPSSQGGPGAGSGTGSSDKEPRPLGALTVFEEGDFHALSTELCRDPQYNDRRLQLRRKLGTMGKEAVRRLALGGASGGPLELATRTSLHTPHTFNGMRVRRQWVYLCRSKKAKQELRRTLGADLAKDLDAAYRNAFLCVAVEEDGLETSLRIHPDAWYDAQNLSHRVAREEGALERWIALLNALPGYFLRLDDWKGEWRCGELDRDRAREFLRYWKPGEHGLRVERRWPAAPGPGRAVALGAEVPEALVAELERLAPLYRFTAWSDESNFLFAR